MNRNDFPILKNNIIYLDNGATTLKPNCVINAITDYYTNYTANAHRGDYDNSLKVDNIYEEVREKVKKFINCNDAKEVIFTSGTTDSLNIIVNGFMKNKLHAGDEVVITKAEHASNVLPWMELAKDIGIVIKYIPLNEYKEVTMENIKNTVSNKTKVISLAAITNVLGYVRPINEIGQYCKEMGFYFVVDGAQSVPHMKTDVIKDNIDFLAFSGHKMLGPTGVGVLYGKKELLEETKPIRVGGGMNSFFESDGSLEYREVPTKFEAGTPNIAGVIGLGAAIDYIIKVGIDNIREHEKYLKKYFLESVKTIDNLIIYNDNTRSTNVAFNLKDVFAQDTAVYLNHYHICVRAGNHCAKILKDELGVKNTCRISFYLYNSTEEIDKLVEALKKSKDIFKVVL